MRWTNAMPLTPLFRLVSGRQHRLMAFKPNRGAIQRYQAAVGALMYAAVSTRPDISFAVGQLSQYASNPDKSHIKALTQVFRYLRGAPDRHASPILVLVGWKTPQHWWDTATQTGQATLLNAAPPLAMPSYSVEALWRGSPSGQRTIALSTVEAEYMGRCLSHQGEHLAPVLIGRTWLCLP